MVLSNKQKIKNKTTSKQNKEERHKSNSKGELIRNKFFGKNEIRNRNIDLKVNIQNKNNYLGIQI